MSKSAPQKKPVRRLTIADLIWDDALRCDHCGKAYPASTPVQIQKEYVIVHCGRADCRYMTPFKRTA